MFKHSSLLAFCFFCPFWAQVFLLRQTSAGNCADLQNATSEDTAAHIRDYLENNVANSSLDNRLGRPGNCIDLQNATSEVAAAHIRNYLENVANSSLNNRLGRPQNCGGTDWVIVADLNINDTSQTCPKAWQLITAGNLRGCRTLEPGSCSSVVFHTGGLTYSQVCGRITAVQYGGPDAFSALFRDGQGLEGNYLDGISLTYGRHGSRMHIWSFTITSSLSSSTRSSCPCIDSTRPWSEVIPSFIGNNYYCDTGNPTLATAKNQYYTDNPVWDGLGCSANSTCCTANNPPWFHTELTVPTSDPVEARLCTNAKRNENVVVTRLEMYVK